MTRSHQHCVSLTLPNSGISVVFPCYRCTCKLLIGRGARGLMNDWTFALQWENQLNVFNVYCPLPFTP